MSRCTTNDQRVACLFATCVLGFLAAQCLAQADEPDPYMSPESEDLDGDGAPDTISAAPGGVEQGPSAPGEVYVVSGENGTVTATLQGSVGGDWFGYSVAVAGDLTLSGDRDLIVGAPKQGRGRAYVFYGPFGDGGNAIVITAGEADMSLGSPFFEDYDFGEQVGPVSDLTADGVPELRVRAWFVDAGSVENTRTYIIDGATADGLFVVTGDDPFDPWAFVEGDVDGDGDVDQEDMETILKNLDLEGDLTTYDGDLNGDDVVDMLDYEIADGNFGFNLFDSIPGPDICHCEGSIWTCDDDDFQPPGGGNIGGICAGGPPFMCCDAICQSSDYFALIDIDLSTYSPPGWCLTEVVQVFEGADLINIISPENQHLVFELTGAMGHLRLGFSFSTCCSDCTYEFEAYIVQPLPGDADGDGFSDLCEGLMETNLQNPYDTPFIGLGDNDDDGIDNLTECQIGLNMNDYDSDGDGMPDGWEQEHGLNPRSANGSMDADNDGIPNFLEYLYGSDPSDPLSGADPALDSDGDGFIDWLEEVLGSDAENPSSVPNVFFNQTSMLWIQVNGILQILDAPMMDLCVGDCFRLHTTGAATSWQVLQGQDLVVLVEPDVPYSCVSGKWCIIAPGDIIIAAATPLLIFS